MTHCHTPFDVEDKDLLDEWLTSQARRKTHVRVPQRGRGVDTGNFILPIGVS